MVCVHEENWKRLDELATERLENTHRGSVKAFFYLGIALYRQCDYENSIRAFE